MFGTTFGWQIPSAPSNYHLNDIHANSMKTNSVLQTKTQWGTSSSLAGHSDVTNTGGQAAGSDQGGAAASSVSLVARGWGSVRAHDIDSTSLQTNNMRQASTQWGTSRSLGGSSSVRNLGGGQSADSGQQGGAFTTVSLWV